MLCFAQIQVDASFCGNESSKKMLLAEIIPGLLALVICPRLNVYRAVFINNFLSFFTSYFERRRQAGICGPPSPGKKSWGGRHWNISHSVREAILNNPAYGRQRISRPMRIDRPILFWVSFVRGGDLIMWPKGQWEAGIWSCDLSANYMKRGQTYIYIYIYKWTSRLYEGIGLRANSLKMLNLRLM